MTKHAQASTRLSSVLAVSGELEVAAAFAVPVSGLYPGGLGAWQNFESQSSVSPDLGLGIKRFAKEEAQSLGCNSELVAF